MANTAPTNSTINGFDDYAETTIYHKVDRIIGRYGFTEDDREDLQQDLALAVIQALKKFDPTRARQSTFISRCVEHRITDIIRHRHRECRDVRRVFRIDDENGTSSDGIASSIPDTRAEQYRHLTDLRIDLSAVIASLPRRLAKIYKMLLKYPPFAISRKLGVSKQSVYRDRDAIRLAFTAAGLHVYANGGKPRAPAA